MRNEKHKRREMNRLKSVSSVPEPSPGDSDEQLLKRFLQSKDYRSFEALFLRHHQFLYRTSYNYCRNKEVAEEAVQEAFVGIWKSSQTSGVDFIPQGENSFRRWFYSVTINKVRQILRRERNAKNRRESVRFLEENQLTLIKKKEGGELPGKDQDRREIVQSLNQTLSNLPQKIREPLVLYFIEGLTYQETANCLGISLALVSHRLNKGLDVLRNQLKKAGFTNTVGSLITLSPALEAISAPASLTQKLGEGALLDSEGVSGEPQELLSQNNSLVSPLIVGLLFTAGIIVGPLMREKPGKAPQPSTDVAVIQPETEAKPEDPPVPEGPVDVRVPMDPEEPQYVEKIWDFNQSLPDDLPLSNDWNWEPAKGMNNSGCLIPSKSPGGLHQISIPLTEKQKKNGFVYSFDVKISPTPQGQLSIFRQFVRKPNDRLRFHYDFLDSQYFIDPNDIYDFKWHKFTIYFSSIIGDIYILSDGRPFQCKKVRQGVGKELIRRRSQEFEVLPVLKLENGILDNLSVREAADSERNKIVKKFSGKIGYALKSTFNNPASSGLGFGTQGSVNLVPGKGSDNSGALEIKGNKKRPGRIFYWVGFLGYGKNRDSATIEFQYCPLDLSACGRIPFQSLTLEAKSETDGIVWQFTWQEVGKALRQNKVIKENIQRSALTTNLKPNHWYKVRIEVSPKYQSIFINDVFRFKQARTKAELPAYGLNFVGHCLIDNLNRRFKE